MPKWELEIKRHRLADHPIRQGLPDEVCHIRCDGELIATVYPVEVGGIGIQVASSVLNFDQAITLEAQADATIAPALIFLKKGVEFQWPTHGS